MGINFIDDGSDSKDTKRYMIKSDDLGNQNLIIKRGKSYIISDNFFKESKYFI